MYKIKIDYFYVDGSCDTRVIDNGYTTHEHAFADAERIAEIECEVLSVGCDPDFSFGIPEDDKYDRGECVKVYRYDQSLNDGTEIVSRYTVVSTDD